MKQALLAGIRNHALWEPGHRVCVAVSGGADSFALLLLLVQTAGAHGAELSAVSIDHGLHPDSANWADQVSTVAASLGVPVEVHRVYPKGSSEEAARHARYTLFDSLDVDRVALAHHRRDQAETLLIHLLRGTGPRGLGGMPRRRDRYVRPLLDCDPRELSRLVEEAGVVPVSDPANKDPRFLRSRIRHQVLPLLEEVRPDCVLGLSRTATLAAEDDLLLERLAEALPFTPQGLRGAPASLARRRISAEIGPGTTAQIDAVMAIVRRGRGAVELPGGRRVVVQPGSVVILGVPDSEPRPG